jgi:hypothetical protein
MAGLMSAATTAVSGGRSLRLYRRNDANTADEEVVNLPGMSIGGNSATATGLQADLSGTPHQVKTVWDSTNNLWNLRGYLGNTDQAGIRVSFAESLLNTLPVNKGGTGLTSFTANGLVYASSTSALATSSAATFDGTNFATTGTATATKLIPTGGAATGNGMYLPEANTVALSTNGTERLRFDSAGGVTVGSATTAAGRIDSVTNGYAAFVARAGTSGENQTVDALKATDSVVGHFANAVYSANSHIWNIAGATQGMRLDSSGNLGLGVTPSAWFAYKAVQVGSASLYASSGIIGMASNSFYPAAGVSHTRINAGFTADYRQEIGEHRWFSDASAAPGSFTPTRRMTLDNSGNLGIGTHLPQSKLDVSGSGSTYMQVRSSNASTGSGYYTTNATRSWLIGAGANSGNSNLEFRDVTGSTTRMTLDTSSNLSIGTTTANARLTVSGSVSWTTGASFAGASGNAAWATGFGSQAINASIQATDSIAGANIYAISDVRLKSNIKPIPSGLAFVNEVDAVQFTWKESGIEDTGFIAQDLLKKGFGHLVSAIPDGAMQELVHDDGNVSPAGSRFVVKYDSVVPILCKAIQEQQALIENLLARVAEIEARWPT